MTTQAAAKQNSILLRPFHRMNSDRMLESTKDSRTPIFLDAPEQLGIYNRSFVRVINEDWKEGDSIETKFQKDEDGNELRRDTRWYVGCKTIFVDQQPKDFAGIKTKDLIYIKGALLEVIDTPQDHQLYLFLKTHNDNVSNPNRVVPVTGEDATAFEEINIQKNSSDKINAIEERELALAALNKTKLGMGAQRTFTDELGRLKAIFGVRAESNDEAFVSLRAIADSDPSSFLRKIEQTRQMVQTDFMAAQSCGAIKYDNGKYIINEKVVFEATSKNAVKQDAEFLEFISKEAGFPVYTEMRNTTQLILTNAK